MQNASANVLTRNARRINEGSSATYKIQFLDGDGVPLSRTAVSALTLTLRDNRTNAVINSRSSQNVLDTNNGSMPANHVITAVTQANPAVVTLSTTHELETGMLVYITGVVGMTELNNRLLRVIKLTSTTVALADVDSTDYTAYGSAGSFRAGLLVMSFQAADNPLVGLALSAATQADPVVVTFTTAHELSDGDEVRISGVVGMTELNNRRFRVRKTAYNAVELVGENGESYAAWASAGTAEPINGDAEPHTARFELTHSDGVVTHGVQLDVVQLI